MQSFDNNQDPATPRSTSRQRSAEDVLDLLFENNLPAFNYLCTIRRNENAPTHGNSTYGDFLLKVGIIKKIERIGKSDSTFQLTVEAEAWFDLHPEKDPIVQDVAQSKRRNMPTVSPVEPKVANPKPALPPTPKLQVEYPIRCVLISGEGVPTKIGIIRSIDDSSVSVEIPAEARTAKFIHERFIATTPPYWRTIANDDDSFDHLDGFKALLAMLIPVAEEQEQPATVSTITGPESRKCTEQIGADTPLQIEAAINSDNLPAIPYEPTRLNFKIDQGLKELFDLSFQSGNGKFRLSAPLEPDHVLVIPDDPYRINIGAKYNWRTDFILPQGTLGSYRPPVVAALPFRLPLEHPFSIAAVEIGDVVFLRNPDPTLWGLFLGVDNECKRAGIWIIASDKQINFMVAAMEERWRYAKIADIDRLAIGLDSETQYALVQKALDLKAHPIDPFPAPPVIPDPPQEKQFFEIATLPRVGHLNRDAFGENKERRAAAKSRDKSPSTKRPEATRQKQARSDSLTPDSPAVVTLSLKSHDQRLAEAKSWIVNRVLPMIESARETNEWSALGSKGWSKEDLTQLHRVCTFYTHTVNNWYKALIALSQEYASSLKHGALKASEIETIKLQVEEKRRSAISGRKSTFDPAAAKEFELVEMPQIISLARKTNDWTQLKPSVMTADYRIRRMVETIQGNASMQTFVRRPIFGLSQHELDLIDGKNPIDPRKAAADFQHALRSIITPIIAKCRLNSDYRALEPGSLAENPLMLAAVEYLGGKPNAFQAFYRNKELPLTEYERTILTAREFTPTRCEEILENRLKPLVALCRDGDSIDFTPIRSLNVKSDRELIALARYLSRSSQTSIRSLLGHPRVGLSDSEIALVYNQTSPERILEIKNTKWAALLAKCRQQNDFSYLCRSALTADPDFAALLSYYSNGRRKDLKDILIQDLGVTEAEQKKIIRVTYTGDYCREITRDKIYPVLLGCLRANDFEAIEFDNLFSDQSILGMANSLLHKRPSVIRLLAHPIVGLSEAEASILVRANTTVHLREQRAAMCGQLIEKVQRLLELSDSNVATT